MPDLTLPTLTPGPIHPQPSIFNATLAATNIDYYRIAARPKWDFAEADKQARKTITKKNAQASRKRGAKS
jgi:hypothetical protein